jgi:hypothetical protein
LTPGDENQVLSQAEIDAMLGNASAGTELDDPLAQPPAELDHERPQAVWSTASPETSLVPTSAPAPPADRRPEPEEAPARRGLFRKILGKPSAESAAPPAETPERPRPALDIEDDLAAAAGAEGTELDASPLAAPNVTAGPLDAAADVMSVFLEHEGMDPHMRRLLERIPDVSVEELLSDLREVCELLGIRYGRAGEQQAA